MGESRKGEEPRTENRELGRNENKGISEQKNKKYRSFPLAYGN